MKKAKKGIYAASWATMLTVFRASGGHEGSHNGEFLFKEAELEELDSKPLGPMFSGGCKHG